MGYRLSISRRQVMDWLGLSPDGNLPMDLSGAFLVPDMWGPDTLGYLHISPGKRSPDGWRSKSSAHRVKVSCRNCHRILSAGRVHQHKC